MQLKSEELVFAITAITLGMGVLAFVLAFTVYRYFGLRLRQQKQLLNAILETQENERGRIAEDMHDSLGQLLAAAKLQTDNLRNITSLKDLPRSVDVVNATLNDASQEVRQIVRNILPRKLDVAGLVPALQDLVATIDSAHDFSASFKVLGTLPEYPKRVELNLYRVVQELALNAVKHSKATSIQFILQSDDDLLRLQVIDDGVGFDPRLTYTGNGMRNLSNRVKLFGGTINFNRNNSSGMCADIVIKQQQLTG